MLAAEGGFAGLIQRRKGVAGKFIAIADNVCGKGAAAAMGKLKGECPPCWESSEVGFLFGCPTYFT